MPEFPLPLPPAPLSGRVRNRASNISAAFHFLSTGLQVQPTGGIVIVGVIQRAPKLYKSIKKLINRADKPKY